MSAVGRIPAWAWGIAAALLLVAAAILVPRLSGWEVYSDFPPLHANLRPRFGWGTVPAVVVGVLAVWFGTRLAARLRWRWLLLAAFAAALAWMVSLGLVDGLDGLGAVLGYPSEYLETARQITDVGAFLQSYIAHIPLDSVDHWPVHIAGHPPGAVLFFAGLVQLGLGSALASGLVVIVLGATTPVAVLVLLRRLGAEREARVAAPFLVIGTSAIWVAVSADGMFAAVAAWGLCVLGLAATSRRWIAVGAWGVLAGLLLGYCVMLSYGLPLLGMLAVGVLVAARSWRPLPFALAAALAVVLVFAVGGFPWWEAYPVLVERYWAGLASDRPFAYWVWGNPAALAMSAGPVLGASLVLAGGRLRAVADRAGGVRVVVLLTAAAALTVLIADLSMMSKAEVERIWLPFVPWLLLGTALLPERARRPALAVQVVAALVIQHLFATRW
jgi:hypothetical protein